MVSVEARIPTARCMTTALSHSVSSRAEILMVIWPSRNIIVVICCDSPITCTLLGALLYNKHFNKHWQRLSIVSEKCTYSIDLIPAWAPWSSRSFAFSWLRTTPSSGRTIIDCSGDRLSHPCSHEESGSAGLLYVRKRFLAVTLQYEGMECSRKRTCTIINVLFHKLLQALFLLAIVVRSVFAGPAIVRHELQPISFGKPVRDPSLDLCNVCVQFSQEFLNELVNIIASKSSTSLDSSKCTGWSSVFQL